MAQTLYDSAQIETPEQIELSLPLAGIGSRAQAYLIDLLCQLVPIVGALVAASLWMHLSEEGPVFGKDAQGVPRLAPRVLAVVSLVIFLVNFGYFALLETFWRGQTPGKRTVGIRVIRDGGFPLDGRGALVRNLLRIVDFLPGFYVVGMLSIFWTGSGKRIGDYAAGTLVVRETPESEGGPYRIAEPPAIGGGLLRPEEFLLLQDFINRKYSLTSLQRGRIATEIARAVAVRRGEPIPATEAAEEYLEGLLARGS